ncbi:hypothetical protein DVH24_006369 [Malus domestica]|uniref:Uncharacterized protein n=1 Tax=Malus domestica TaxID=3750 RepID=A0A498KHR9_MALDO|nr:hypothetical protein DVH24_006369 [Malus domestica]
MEKIKKTKNDYGRRSRSNLEIQRLREKIKIEPGDAAAAGEDEEEGGKRQRRWNEDDRTF